MNQQILITPNICLGVKIPGGKIKYIITAIIIRYRSVDGNNNLVLNTGHSIEFTINEKINGLVLVDSKRDDINIEDNISSLLNIYSHDFNIDEKDSQQYIDKVLEYMEINLLEMISKMTDKIEIDTLTFVR
jgi:hypothetical protein